MFIMNIKIFIFCILSTLSITLNVHGVTKNNPKNRSKSTTTETTNTANKKPIQKPKRLVWERRTDKIRLIGGIIETGIGLAGLKATGPLAYDSIQALGRLPYLLPQADEAIQAGRIRNRAILIISNYRTTANFALASSLVLTVRGLTDIFYGIFSYQQTVK